MLQKKAKKMKPHDADKSLKVSATPKSKKLTISSAPGGTNRKMKNPTHMPVHDAGGATISHNGIPSKGRLMKTSALMQKAASSKKKDTLKWYDPIITSPTPQGIEEHRTMSGRPLAGAAGGGTLGALTGGTMGGLMGGAEGAAAGLYAGGVIGGIFGGLGGSYSANKKIMKDRISKGKKSISKSDLRDQYQAARIGYYNNR